MGKILGIDLGTTNSCMAVMQGSEPVVIENSEGARTTPSIVAFTNGGERLVGPAAKRRAVTNAQNTVSSITRFLGRKYEEVREEAKRVPYKIVKAPDGDAHIEVEVAGDRKTFSPREISAMILGKLKSDAESWLGEKITQAVIAVPAYFNDAQRNATKDAARMAGLEVFLIIDEPAAACLAYGLEKEKGEKIAVYHLGGGTFNISVLEIGEGAFEMKATSGDTHLGGDDWDNCLTDWIISEFRRDTGIDLSNQSDALQRIKEEAEKAKITLSSSLEYEINLQFITAEATGPKHIQKKLTRGKLEQLTDELFERMIRPVRACLGDANLSESPINELVLVGGMTRMPRVIQMARQLVGKEPHEGINPDEVVAIGAAVQGNALRRDFDNMLLPGPEEVLAAAGGPTAEPTGFDTAFGTDFGQESRGIAAPDRPRESSELPASVGDGGASPSRLPVPAQATQGSRPESSSEERPARYADFAFFWQTASGQQGGRIAPQAPLIANTKYQLEVSIRSKTVGIQSSAERVAISEPGQDAPVKILVIADSEDFEIPEPVQRLILPPTGDSHDNACFRGVRPTRKTNTKTELARIRVRLYYNLNLLEVVIISAEVVSPLEDANRSRLDLDPPISLVQQLRERDYRNFDLIMPRSMHIFVERGQGCFQLTFTLEREGERELTLTGSSRIPESSLEDSLVSIRKTLLGISIWKVFGSAVDCPDQNLFSKGMRDLATQGRELWTKIFELERGSSLYVIGEWFRAHPLPAGSRIQVSVDPSATAFILPWNLLYDGAVPAKSDVPIASDGFWGLRYQIEQRSRFAYDHCDGPVATNGPLDIGFLRSPIAEAALHLQALQGLVEMSQGRIATINPIESATEAYRYLEECPSHIVSFFAHGHTKFAESARTGFTEEDFVALYEDTSDPSLRDSWKELYDEIKARQYQSDSSWIKLRYGKLYLLELYQKIQELRTGPVVLLNMCESAQLTPSLQESFIHFFLDRGARAVLGTECSMRPLFAHQFAQKILESLVFGDTIGEALLNARKEFVSRGNPLGLAYTLFGSLTIRFNPPPLERA